MSHVVTIKTQVRDPIAIQSACDRLRLPTPVFGTAKLFTSEATGWQVTLPEWRYPVVCETANGELKFDNFNGHWGNPLHLDGFLQAYAVEKAKLEARKHDSTPPARDPSVCACSRGNVCPLASSTIATRTRAANAGQLDGEVETHLS